MRKLLLFISQFVTLLGLKRIAAFLSSHFSPRQKKSEQKIQTLKNEKILQGAIKIIFQDFEKVFVARNYYRPENGPLDIDKKYKVI